MTHFRKRLSAEVINRFNEKIIELARKDSSPDDDPPPKVVDSDILKQQLTDNSARNAIEGKFGQCKRRLWLRRIMAQRKNSSETVITITILTTT